MAGDPGTSPLDPKMISTNGFKDNHPPLKEYETGPPLYFCERNDKPHSSVSAEEDAQSLGPLPPKWEKAYTENGEVYFIDHNSGTSHWLDPRLSKFQKKSLEDCMDDELPYGWEKISDPQYGTYFIDHVNRRTQYENPVIQAKRAAERSLSEVPLQSASSFTRNPAELCGERFSTTLLKSSRGLGFTIVGGDDSVDEFLQIKSIVPNGPAWLDAKLQTGDLLVYVNDICVLGFKHHEMVSVFQSILPGETVVLEVCRGYPLPFDPNDPNTEVVTTIAVDAPSKTQMYMDLNMDGNYNFLDMSGDSSNQNKKEQINQCGASVLSDSIDTIMNDCLPDQTDKHDIISVSIIKGSMGFGFTIADSTCGQKVKKILDRQRCKNLMENDILLAINSISVSEMCHGDVVQVLKDCPRNHEATIKVQRGGFMNGSNTSSKNKNRKVLDSNKFSTKNVGTGLFRSKTPTADLYSTQTKEILPTRPKTPLVDTRVRTKTPLAEIDTNGEIEQVNAEAKSHFETDITDGSYTDSYATKVNNITEKISTSSLHDNHDNKHVDDNSIHTREFGSSQNDLNNHYVPQEYYNYNNSILNGYSSNGHHESCFCYDCKEYKLADYNVNSVSREILQDGKIVQMPSDCIDRRKESTSFEHGDPYQGPPTNWNWMGYSGQRIQQPIQEIESLVTLIRQESGFGFRIVGGTEEGSQVAVGHIVPGGAADLDSRICTGDDILSVDGQSVINTSHHQVVQLMGAAAHIGRVTLGLRRRVPQQEILMPSVPHLLAYPYDVIVKRNENEGFGFVIISSINKAGSTIGRLIEGSPAERCGQLRIGDRILAVNHMDISHLSHGDIVNLIKESGYVVTLTIGLPFNTNKPMQGQYIPS